MMKYVHSTKSKYTKTLTDHTMPLAPLYLEAKNRETSPHARQTHSPYKDRRASFHRKAEIQEPGLLVIHENERHSY